MNRSVAIGTALAIVIVGGSLLAPTMLPGRGVSEADREAARIGRDLVNYRPMLPVAEQRIGASSLNSAEASRIVQSAPDRFEDARSRLQKVAQEVRASDQAIQKEFHYPASEAMPAGAGPSDVAKSISGFEDWATKENATLLSGALKGAPGGGTVASAYINGVAQMTESSRMQDQARLMRATMTPLQAAVIENASVWRELHARAEAADTEAVRIGDLKTQLTETESDLRTATADRDALKARVEGMRNEVAQIDEELSALQTALIELDDAGFEARNDTSFNSYANKRREIVGRQRDLQRRHEELTLGGAANAEFDGPDLMTADFSGEAVDGLRVAERELELAEARVSAFDNGRKRITDAINEYDQLASNSEKDAEALNKLADARKAEIDQQVERLTQLATQTMDAESKAIDAARAAVRSFDSSASAAAKVMSDASETRREYDSQGKNPRLSMISRDSGLQSIPKTTAAYAKLRVGRLLVERAARLTNLQGTFEQLLAAIPGATSSVPETTTEAIETARSEALTALNDALQGLEGDTWSAKAGRALAHVALARIDSADEHREQAVTLLNEALPNPLFPNAAALVALRDRLGAPQPGEPPADPDEDFFAP
ncbi:MAG: hypothetical protein KDA32_04650 [Phycisphaerales bacterium]|nr:hypothetical protein [Phycisphaerales bacterium]